MFTREMGLFAAALVLIAAEAARLTESDSPRPGIGDLKVNDSVPSVVVPPIEKKDDLEAFLSGPRANPFARPGGGGSQINLSDVNARTGTNQPPLTTVNPPPPKPKLEIPKNPSPPPPPPPKNPPADTAKTPKPYELPVSLAGVMTVDGVRRVVLQVKDNQYYLTMQPGEKLDALGIEVVSVEGEEVTLKSTKTGETFLLRDLIDFMKKDAGTAKQP
jgi:hypothetical protein